MSAFYVCCWYQGLAGAATGGMGRQPQQQGGFGNWQDRVSDVAFSGHYQMMIGDLRVGICACVCAQVNSMAGGKEEGGPVKQGLSAFYNGGVAGQHFRGNTPAQSN